MHMDGTPCYRDEDVFSRLDKLIAQGWGNTPQPLIPLLIAKGMQPTPEPDTPKTGRPKTRKIKHCLDCGRKIDYDAIRCSPCARIEILARPAMRAIA